MEQQSIEIIADPKEGIQSLLCLVGWTNGLHRLEEQRRCSQPQLVTGPRLLFGHVVLPGRIDMVDEVAAQEASGRVARGSDAEEDVHDAELRMSQTEVMISMPKFSQACRLAALTSQKILRISSGTGPGGPFPPLSSQLICSTSMMVKALPMSILALSI